MSASICRLGRKMVIFFYSYMRRLRRRGERSLFLLSVLSGFIISPPVMAGCLWANVSENRSSTAQTVTFDIAGKKLLANRYWIENPRNPYPVGSYLGIAEMQVRSEFCQPSTFNELKGHIAQVVYYPPVTASPWGAGYRVPTSNPSVAIDIEFPNGTPFPGGGILLSTSKGEVTEYGGLGGTTNVFNDFPIKISLVKTGVFTADHTKNTIVDTEGIGVFRFHSSSNMALIDSFSQPLRMPVKYSVRLGEPALLGVASAPYCNFLLEANDFALITLSPVSSSVFRGIGPVNDGAQHKQFVFVCRGLGQMQPELYFEATYPLGDGQYGVGMETATSDVGVQILFEDKPIRLGAEYPLLFTQITDPIPDYLHNGEDWEKGLPSQGHICISSCSADMTTANWINTQPRQSDTISAPVGFRYYQTTRATPRPGRFSVPFTVNIDIQ